MTVGEACSLVVNGTYTQEGWNPAGLDLGGRGWTVVDGVLLPATSDTLRFVAGTLEGSGTVAGDVTSGAWVNPGARLGELTIDGSYIQSEDGVLFIEIGGREAGEYDHLRVEAGANLSGTLWIQIVDDFTAAPGDTFRVLDCALRTGTFDLEWGAPGIGLQYEVLYGEDCVDVVLYQDLSEVEDEAEEASSGEEASFSSRTELFAFLEELRILNGVVGREGDEDDVSIGREEKPPST